MIHVQTIIKTDSGLETWLNNLVKDYKIISVMLVEGQQGNMTGYAAYKVVYQNKLD